MNHHFFTTAWLSRAVLYFLLTIIWSEKLVRRFRLLLTAAQVVVFKVPHIRRAPEICTRILLEGRCLGFWELWWELFSSSFSVFFWVFWWHCWCTLPHFSLCVLLLPFAFPFLTTSLHGCVTVCNCMKLVVSVTWETWLEIVARASELLVHVDWVAWRAALSSETSPVREDTRDSSWVILAACRAIEQYWQTKGVSLQASFWNCDLETPMQYRWYHIPQAPSHWTASSSFSRMLAQQRSQTTSAQVERPAPPVAVVAEWETLTGVRACLAAVEVVLVGGFRPPGMAVEADDFSLFFSTGSGASAIATLVQGKETQL